MRRARPRRAVWGRAQVVPRIARDIPDPSCTRAQRRQVSVKAHKTTGAQTTEPEHPREPGENGSARVPNFECQEMTICRTPSPSHEDTSDEWYQYF